MGLAVSQSPLFPLLYEAKMGSAGRGHGPTFTCPNTGIK